MSSGWLYDGLTAQRHAVSVTRVGGRLHLAGHAPTGDDLDPAMLVVVERRADVRVIGHRDRPGWRLVLAEPVKYEVDVVLPEGGAFGGWIDRFGLLRFCLVAAGISALVMLVAYRLPHWVAPHVPDRWLDAYGDALVGDYGGRFCNGPGGQAALDRLARRLAPGQRGVTIRVVDIPVVNAAALPGGNIVVFEELLSEAGSAEEFAGVLAHELAHVGNRDVTEAMVRELGFGLVLGAVGGNAGGRMHQIASLSYSREAETRADRTAIRTLAAAGISPVPTADFFDRLMKEDGGSDRALPLFPYLATHPAASSRAELFRSADGGEIEPALTRDEWDAVVDICHNDPKRRAAAASD